jgi:hypothetical protein
MVAPHGFARHSPARRRKAAVTAALTLSAASIVGASGTSMADVPGPLDPLAAATAPVTAVTQPVAAPVAAATAPVAAPVQAVATATKPVTQAVATTTKPVTQAVATTTKPVTQAVATTTKPVTQAVATTTKPLTQAVATTTTSATKTTATTTKPLTQAVATTTTSATKTTATTTKPVTQAVATTTKPAIHAAAPRSTRVAQTSRATHSATAVPARTRRARHVRAAAGGRAVGVPSPMRPHARPISATTIALSPLAGAFAASFVMSSPSPHVTGTPSGGGSSSNTALGLIALIGAAGVAVLRARQLSAAAGVADIGTLTALGHSASIFWAGSCVPLGTTGSAGTAATMNASLAADQLSPSRALGSRAQFGVRGALSRVGGAAGGRAPLPLATIRDPAGDDRTGLAALLFALSAIIGAALGAMGPRRQGA